MKALGLIGGTSWVSTVDYYTIINQRINKLLGGLNSAKIHLYSLNFEELKPPVNPGDWGEISKTLSNIALGLEKAGAECIVLCANTPHLVADLIQQKINIPVINIATATADVITDKNLRKVALLGTRITMEQGFFKDKLIEKKIEVLIPDDDDRQFIHDAVFNELGKEIFLPETKNRFLQIINRLIEQGAEGVILGCTEFPHLIKPEDCIVPTFDTTLIHADAAVKFALSDQSV
jgi:aspartate racemase